MEAEMTAECGNRQANATAPWSSRGFGFEADADGTLGASMDARHAAALAFRGMCAVGILLTVSCGGGGGGGGCSTPASTSECGSGEICSNIQGDGNQCRPLCSTQAECPAGENCNGIANTNLKSCQPAPATPTPQANPTPKK
jgi:hypothetical protein